MKTFFKFFIAALAAVAALVSCSKEIASDKSDSRGGNPVKAEKITVNVEALMGELTPAEETKAGIAPVIRLAWADNDSVFAYCGSEYLGKLGITPKVERTSAVLSGIITAPKGTAITLVYSNVDFEDAGNNGALTFDFSNQDGTVENPFVAYGTLFCENQTTTVTNQSVPFTFATSLMRIAVTGLDKAAIDSVSIKGFNTSCCLSLEENFEPKVSAATSAGTIVKKGIAVGDIQDERAILDISVVMTEAEDSENTARKITVYQGLKRYGAALTKGAIDLGRSYISVYALKETDGSKGKINDHDYIYIAGTRWATQNLAISESGIKAWKGARTGENPEVKVPGTGENVIVGDYFQWAAYAGYCGSEDGSDKGLLIYDSFTNDCCVGENTKNEFSLKGSYWFNNSDDQNLIYSGISPYYKKGQSYTKYNNRVGQSDDRTVLELTDDVAHILWGDNWRMPTNEEFRSLYNVTFWAWDATDRGYYVFLPADAGQSKGGTYGNIGNLDKSKALLFFPCSGSGFNTELSVVTGYYWQSTLHDTSNAKYMSITPNNVDFSYLARCYGCSVRPVSD